MAEPRDLEGRSKLFFQRQPGQARLFLSLQTTFAVALIVLAVVFAVQGNWSGVAFCAGFGLLAGLLSWLLFKGIRRSLSRRGSQ